MFSCSAISVICLLAFQSASANKWKDAILHESTEHLPPGWALHPSTSNQEDLLRLHVAIAQPNDEFVRIATAVSDPSSPRYGQYLDDNDLNQILLRHADPRRPGAVKQWLLASGARDVQAEGREWVHFTMSVKDASGMLSTQFNKYTYGTEKPSYRALSYSLPSYLTKHIDFIYPVTQFLHTLTSPEPIKSSITSRQHFPGPVFCNNSVCPEELRKTYNLNYVPPNDQSGSRVGIAGFLEEYANHKDNQYFQTHYANYTTAPPDFSVELINGGKNPQTSGGVEAMLDVEYVQAFTGPLNVTYFSTPGRPPTLDNHGRKPVAVNESKNEPFLAFVEYLLKMKSPPQVISISYSDTEQTVPLRFANRVCNQFALLAARGVSVIGASGDGGASGTGNSDCQRSNGKTAFLPTFPSSCPWYTSVGATAGYGGAASFSSGGFSNYFSTPSWQKAATSAYIKTLGKKHAGYYNATGRGIPDVTLLGDDYLIWDGGYASSHDGTSASTPVFASMIALLNDLRLWAGKPVLGFLNPLLYSDNVAKTFTDIKTGQINGCSNDAGFQPGFTAVAGWDPASGLGAPDFAKLRAVLV